MNHKYLHRETRKAIYMSAEGKKFHDASPEAADFIYVGPISQKDQEKEELDAIEKGSQAKEDEKGSSIDNTKTNVSVKELTAEELEEFIKKKKIKLTPEETALLQEREDETPEEKEKRLALTQDILTRKK